MGIDFILGVMAMAGSLGTSVIWWRAWQVFNRFYKIDKKDRAGVRKAKMALKREIPADIVSIALLFWAIVEIGSKSSKDNWKVGCWLFNDEIVARFSGVLTVVAVLILIAGILVGVNATVRELKKVEK